MLASVPRQSGGDVESQTHPRLAILDVFGVIPSEICLWAFQCFVCPKEQEMGQLPTKTRDPMLVSCFDLPCFDSC